SHLAHRPNDPALALMPLDQAWVGLEEPLADSLGFGISNNQTVLGLGVFSELLPPHTVNESEINSFGFLALFLKLGLPFLWILDMSHSFRSANSHHHLISGFVDVP